MSERLIAHLREIATSTAGEEDIRVRFIERAGKGSLTRDKDPETHFCVYFAAYDPDSKVVFIGHHIKSGLWLFNGGHIDEGELPREALRREIGEEWGEGIKIDGTERPSLITLTELNNPNKQITCKWHYDIWYFIPLKQESFTPDESLLQKEFHQTGWKTVEEARRLIEDANTLTALTKIEDSFRND